MAEQDHVTMTESHYQKLKRESKAARDAGLHGEAALLTAKANKNAFLTLGAAGIGYWILQSETLNKISVFREYWWAKPLLVLGIGWYLWRKQNPYAHLVLALGAVSLVDAYRGMKAREGKKGKAGYDANGYPIDKRDGDTKGPDDEAGYEGRIGWGEGRYASRDRLREGDGREIADRIFRGAVAA